MGTRGSWGFIVNGQRWETYNHFDSYPAGLGETLLAWGKGVQEVDAWSGVADRVESLTLIGDETPPPSADLLAKLAAAGIADLGVSTGKDWYAALRRCQGDPSVTLDSRFWIDGAGFHKDALFCEWSYVFDLDRRVFAVYEGQSVTSGATYLVKGGGRGYASVLVSQTPFDRLPFVVLMEDGTTLETPGAVSAAPGEGPAALEP